MVTSNSTDYNISAIKIIKGAMRKLGVLGEGETPSGEKLENAMESLNLMVKQWQAKGYNMWVKTEAILFFNSGQQSYELGLTGSDRVSDVSNVSLTALYADVLSGASTVDVLDATGIEMPTSFGIVSTLPPPIGSMVTNVAGASISFADAITEDATRGNPVVPIQKKNPPS